LSCESIVNLVNLSRYLSNDRLVLRVPLLIWSTQLFLLWQWMCRRFCNLCTCVFKAFERPTCRRIYTAVMTHQHRGASFDDPVVWLVWTFEVTAVGYGGGNTLRLAAEIQVTKSGFRLVDAI
jgi:hypothetical protein